MASRMISPKVGCGNTSFLSRAGGSCVSIIIPAVSISYVAQGPTMWQPMS